jgi:uncharacterized membrane protein YdjX (TVP38/TMEM64 family)
MKRSVRVGIVFFAVFIAASVAICLLIRPFMVNLRTSEYRQRFSAWIESMGVKGVAILLGIQVLQIVVAVIPGGPMELVAGAAYGTWGGFALCILGCLAAASGIFLAVRTFGAPLVERFFGTELTGRYRFLGDAKKFSLALFLIFLIPGTPKDALTYIAPLGNIKPGRFLLITTAARAPAILMSTMLGSSALRGNWTLLLLLFLATALTGIVGLLYGGQIADRIRHKHCR